MSLRIYLAHSGRVLQADPISFASPDALKSWIEAQAHIAVDRQILITGRGKNVRQQTLLTESEVFVYDKQNISTSPGARPPETPSPPPLHLPPPPTTLSSQTSLQAWRNLFRSRRDWAVQLTEALAPYRDTIRQALVEADNIQRASSLALDNLQSHVRNIRNKFEDRGSWAQAAIEDHENILSDWAGNFQVLGEIPGKNEFASLLQGPRTATKTTTQRKREPTEQGFLSAFINKADVEEAASELTLAARDFKRRLEALDATMGDISADTRQIETLNHTGISVLTPGDVQDLYSNVETVSRKIAADYEELIQLPDVQKSVSTASRRALFHTRDLLPALQKSAAEISDSAQQVVLHRNTCLEASTRALHTISRVQSGLVDFQAQLRNFGLAPEHVQAYDVVRNVFDLPTAYGAILIESIRRSEWSVKLRADTDRVEAELKSQTDEENRRRKKWIKSMGGMVTDDADATPTGAEMSVFRSDASWPLTDRQEVFKYIDALRAAQLDEAVQHLTHLLKELDSSQSRRRRPRAFKTGSLHDAELALGRSSVLLEDEDEATKVLRSEKSRLEDKLRGSDSRIRKLEDLLHRHGQMNRTSGANFGPPPLEADRRAQSPVGPSSPRTNELMSRRSSVSSRRLSSNQNPDDKILVQRIVSLEADLHAERETFLKVQREAHADRRASTESRDRMNEAESTKRDLLANFEAQRQEFDDERQLLEDEMHKLKIRSEEVEDELDRVLGSRDHQGLTSNATIAHLQTEIERLGRESSAQLAAASDRAELSKNDLELDRNRVNSLETQLQQMKENSRSLQTENLKLADQLRDQVNAEDKYRSSLQAAHSHLFPGGAVPDDLRRLLTAIETLSEGMATHTQNADGAARLAATEKNLIEGQLGETKGQLELAQTKLAQTKLSTGGEENLSLRDALAQERSKYASSRDEVAAAQGELNNLRAKFAVGETGSDTLRERMTEEEHKITDLCEKLAVAESNGRSFEQEMLTWKDKASSLTTEARYLQDRLDVRGVRAKDLSQRLLSINDRLVRTLEQMGYSVVRQDDRLVIQRSSKVNASTVSIVDGPTAVRSPSGQVPTPYSSSPSNLATLYWMSEPDANAESDKFQSFISTLSLVDIDAAAEMITKRHRDVETLARKYQKDSRAYREKAQRLHSEAHDKIAYRTFKEGDLALFLPTRNQATRPWAAFNVGAPHYFLREQDTHKLQTRDWLLARISKVEERVVDLSKSLANGQPGGHTNSSSTGNDRRSINTEASELDDENPFELSDGLRWYLIDASEEKPGSAPVLTPGLGRSTVAATNVDATGSIRLTKEGKKARDVSGSGAGGVSATIATKTLSKSLDSHSRRSSSASKRYATSPSRASNAAAVTANESPRVESSSRPTSSSANANASTSASTNTQPTDPPSKGPAREEAAIFEAETASAGTRGRTTRVQNGLASIPNTPPQLTMTARTPQQQQRPSRPSTLANVSPTKQQQQQQESSTKTIASSTSPSPKKENKPATSGSGSGSSRAGGGGGGWEWDKLWNLDYQL